MILNLGNDYRITSDAYCYIVQKEVEVTRRSTGLVEKEFKDIGFCPSINSALKYIVDKELKTTNASDLESLVNKVDELKKYIDDVVPHVPHEIR